MFYVFLLLLLLLFMLFFYLGNEIFEKLGVIGMLVNFLIYLILVFNMKSMMVVIMFNIFNGSINLVILVGVFFCDIYFGCYKILGFVIMVFFLVVVFIYIV